MSYLALDRRTAKPPFVGSNPTRASIRLRSGERSFLRDGGKFPADVQVRTSFGRMPAVEFRSEISQSTRGQRSVRMRMATENAGVKPFAFRFKTEISNVSQTGAPRTELELPTAAPPRLTLLNLATNSKQDS